MERSKVEQQDALVRLMKAAGALHKVNLELRDEQGDVMEVTGHQYARDVSIVYVTDPGGYDLWHYDITKSRSCCEGWNNCVGHLIQADLPLEAAASIMAEAYMRSKAKVVLVKTLGVDPVEAERILNDREEREEFYALLDAGSEKAKEKFLKRHTN